MSYLVVLAQGDSGAGSSFVSLPEGEAYTQIKSGSTSGLASSATSARRNRARPEARLSGLEPPSPPRLSNPVAASISSLPIVIPKGEPHTDNILFYKMNFSRR